MRANIDMETGEILALVDAVPLDELELIRFVGERRANALARLAGLRAERQNHLDRIAAQYDSRIRRAESLVELISSTYAPALEDYTRRRILGRKEKFVDTGLMRLGFRTSREGFEVEDEDAAIAWAKEYVPQAVKVTERVLVSELDDNYKDDARRGKFPGITWKAPAEVFYVK